MIPPTDTELVRRTVEGDRQAFGQLVERHQAVVCGVAYSVVGDFSRSEDLGQEAFVAAWRGLGQLREPGKFKPWICGIARNLALLFLRREPVVRPLDPAAPLPSGEAPPAEQLILREEEALVWQALARLPETYREPLVLFYREEQSVARVAETLELSLDATKQRLARGREMLRRELAFTIERTLARSAPSKAFTLAVVGAISGVGAASAGAATVATAGKAAAPWAAKGALAAGAAAWLGPLAGMFGGALGAWLGDRSMRFERERAAYRRGQIGFLVITAVWIVPALAMEWTGWESTAALGPAGGFVLDIAWVLSIFIAVGIWAWRLNRRLRQVRAEEIASAATELPRNWLTRLMARWEGRRWTSRGQLFGLPLVDIHYSNPMDVVWSDTLRSDQPFARGWIALGDRACGLIAIGQFAVGGIALGGVSCGVLSFGGMSFGLFSMGGLAVGLISCGGGAIGGLALGGLAIGWLAIGGGAIGWVATGGGAMAWHAAKGGLAIAHDFAIGGQASALHANDQAAQAYFESSPLAQTAERTMQWIFHPSEGLIYFIVICCVLVAIQAVGTLLVAYRRKQS